MLPILIAIAWLVAVYLGWMMCRLAALSDESHTSALAEWLAAVEPESATAEELAEDDDQADTHYRATG